MPAANIDLGIERRGSRTTQSSALKNEKKQRRKEPRASQDVCVAGTCRCCGYRWVGAARPHRLVNDTVSAAPTSGPIAPADDDVLQGGRRRRGDLYRQRTHLSTSHVTLHNIPLYPTCSVCIYCACQTFHSGQRIEINKHENSRRSIPLFRAVNRLQLTCAKLKHWLKKILVRTFLLICQQVVFYFNDFCLFSMFRPCTAQAALEVISLLPSTLTVFSVFQIK